jgi:high-affinity iron transporter
MTTSFLITLREGLEASLIVAILLTYLSKTNRKADARYVWSGTIAAVVACLVAGTAIYLAVDGLHGKVEQAVEGTIALAAAAVLTQMIFWMKKNSQNLSAELRAKVDASAKTALFVIAFVVSIILGVAIFAGGRKVNLKQFFNVTAVLLILFAAGLAGKAVHEYRELIGWENGWLVQSAWEMSKGSIWESGTFYDFMKGFFGWHYAAENIRVITYFLFLLPTLYFYRKPVQSAA